jgi:hypothetical protein
MKDLTHAYLDGYNDANAITVDEEVARHNQQSFSRLIAGIKLLFKTDVRFFELYRIGPVFLLTVRD